MVDSFASEGRRSPLCTRRRCITFGGIESIGRSFASRGLLRNFAFRRPAGRAGPYSTAEEGTELREIVDFTSVSPPLPRFHRGGVPIRYNILINNLCYYS